MGMLCGRAICRISPRWLVGSLALYAATGANAAAQETRHFDIAVDGRKAGTYQVSFREEAGGGLAVSYKANVRVTVLAVFTYTYSLDGSEHWIDGQLARWDAKANDDGTRYAGSGRRVDQGFRVTVNGKVRAVESGFLLTTYVLKPSGEPRGQKQTLLEPDTGKELQSVMDAVGVEERRIAGQKQACVHLRWRGGVHVDAWYDARGRLVHQESLEDGHRTMLRLTEISR